ncbi:MAG: KTSC domain-containing protein, partial [Actinobacteria bacterium]|nr:KTSC domain-containing protein [Actinomycetota bacterium]
MYGTGDLQVRLPSHAAMGRYVRDHPEVRVFDVPAELVSDGSRGMGMVRLARSEETGQWQVIGGSGAYGGTGEWAQRSREAVGAVVAGRRPRATMAELRAASAEARRRLEGSESGAVAGETTTRLLPELGWTDVESSALSRVGYDPVTRRMEVQFNDGRRASYRNVPPAQHRALITSSSVGRYYSLNIRSNPAYLGHGFPSSPPEATASQVESGPSPRGGSDGSHAAAGPQSCSACGRFVGPGEAHVCVAATNPRAMGAPGQPVATAGAVVRADGALSGAGHPVGPDEGAGRERDEEGDEVLRELSDVETPAHGNTRLEAGV